VLVTGFVCLNYLIIIREKSDSLDRSSGQVILFSVVILYLCVTVQ